MIGVIHNFFTRSISRMVMASFVFVLLLPLGFLFTVLPQQSWGSVKQEILNKHEMVARSTGDTIRLYFSSYQKSLQVFANTSDLINSNDTETIKTSMSGLFKSLENVDVISFLSLDDYSRVVSVKPNQQALGQNVVTNPFLKYLTFGNRHESISNVSSVFKSTITKRPVVLLKTYVYDRKNTKRGVLFAEVGIDYFSKLCRQINNRGKEYCSIVDSSGQVVAHPNREWVEKNFNISRMPIVQEIKKGESGTMDFYSPNLKQNAVAGFVTIKNLGWGVMISQSESDLDSPLRSVMFTILKWLVLGVFFALIIAFILTREITKPLSTLVLKSKEIGVRSTFNLGSIPKNSPQEITQLWIALASSMARLQRSNDEVKKLNYSLSRDIQKATAKLRKTNRYLFKISSRDHLTKIANRRYFEEKVDKTLKTNIGEKASIILIDVDKFKFINDTYGHDAGDFALVHIAQLMQKCTRDDDLPARLGGDEFVISIKDCGPKSLARVSENLRKAVEDNPIMWAGQEIKLTLSIGTVNHDIDGKIGLTELLKFADEAMYISKKQGRNHVSAYSFEVAAKVANAKKLLAAKASNAKNIASVLTEDNPLN